MKTKSGLGVILFILIFCISSPAESQSGDEWAFQIAPYAWLAGVKGKVATLPGLLPTDVDLDFYDDVLGNTNGALFLVGEARKGRWGGSADIAYTDIEDEDATPGPFFSSANQRSKSWIVSAAGFYRLTESQRAFLDVLAGIRYWSVDSELRLKGAAFPLLFPEQSISNKEDWIDPIVGLKGLAPIGESKFFVSGVFVLGGFGVKSDFVYDTTVNLGYQWTKVFSTTLGYRYLDVDYEDGDFLYDVSQQGLVLGLSFRF